jgi:hypothetical protein
MKPILKLSLIGASATALVLGGAVFAFAGGWSTSSAAASMTIDAIDMPVGSKPTAELDGADVTLAWADDEIAAGVPVQTYLVTRHGAGGSTLVCTVATTTCVDPAVPAGSWTYTVQTGYETWRGVAGQHSEAVVVEAAAAAVHNGIVAGEPAPDQPKAPAADVDPSASPSPEPQKVEPAADDTPAADQPADDTPPAADEPGPDVEPTDTAEPQEP